MPQSILIIDDSMFYRNMVKHILLTFIPDAIITEYDPISEGKPAASFHWGQYDVLILDYLLGEENGLQWLADYAQIDHFPVTVFLTGEGSETVAVDAMKLGAEDYIAKRDLTPERLQQGIEKALQKREQQNDITKTQLNQLTGSNSLSKNRHTIFSENQLAQENIEINHYKLKECIGKGGMANVFSAIDLNTDKNVAIKLLEVDKGENSFLDRFIEEYETASKINHPNIIKIYDQGFTDTYAYFAMEHLTGGDLKQRMKDGIDTLTVAKTIRDIASALQELHNHSIIHRDIKPSNILFDDNERVVLVDFGVAKSLRDRKEITNHGEAIGTPGYMCPEQIQSKAIDTRCDLYSLGVLFFHLIEGVHPFIATSPSAQMYKHVYEETPVLKNCSEEINDMVHKLMAKSPGQRYLCAQALIDDLNIYLEKES